MHLHFLLVSPVPGDICQSRDFSPPECLVKPLGPDTARCKAMCGPDVEHILQLKMLRFREHGHLSRVMDGASGGLGSGLALALSTPSPTRVLLLSGPERAEPASSSVFALAAGCWQGLPNGTLPTAHEAERETNKRNTRI